MRKRTLFISIIIAISAAVAAPASAATRDASAEQQSLDLANAERRAHGVAPLESLARIASIAREHSARMAADGELRHNDDLPSQVGPFRALGENVGYGATADEVHDAFMGSSSHRHAILAAKYTHVGIGVVRDGEIVWITQVFFTPDRTSQPKQEPATVTRQRSSARPALDPPARRLVRAQSATSVRPVRDRTDRPRAARLTRVSRTVAMLQAMASIDRQVTARRFVASRPVWA